MKKYALELSKNGNTELIDLYDLEGQALRMGNELKANGALEGTLALMRVEVDQWGQYAAKDSLFLTAWF